MNFGQRGGGWNNMGGGFRGGYGGQMGPRGGMTAGYGRGFSRGGPPGFGGLGNRPQGFGGFADNFGNPGADVPSGFQTGFSGFGGPRGPRPSLDGGNTWNCVQDDFKEEGFGGGNIGNNHMGQPQLSPPQVFAWLDCQEPGLIRGVMFHCRWLLEQMGAPLEVNQVNREDGEGGPEVGDGEGDMSGWYEGDAASLPQANGNGRGMGPPAKRGRIGFGFPRGGGHMPTGPLQWTPGGWAPKDNVHKVTSMIKPLPEPALIPPASESSANYPEANADRNKLKMLENNVKMMTFELTKLCRKYKLNDLDKEDTSKYSEEQHPRLLTTITCVKAAEKTLTEFKEFLKEEKYKEWNDEQTKKYEESIKSMIGDTPTGTPHKKPAAAETDEQQQSEGNKPSLSADEKAGLS